MARYDMATLQAMAKKKCLSAKEQLDPRYLELLITLSGITGLDPDGVEDGIRKLAAGIRPNL